jgi:hypothetical protein
MILDDRVNRKSLIVLVPLRRPMMSENDGRVFRNHGREISPKPAMFEHFKLCLLYLSHAAAISVATKTSCIALRTGNLGTRRPAMDFAAPLPFRLSPVHFSRVDLGPCRQIVRRQSLLSRSGFSVPLPGNEFQVPPRIPLASTLAYLVVEVAQCVIPYSPRISSLVSRRTLRMGRFRRCENSVVTSLWLSTAVSCDCYSVR